MMMETAPHWSARTWLRGDWTWIVDHVIMFDFPLNSIDYLHRTGRTARMGAKGKVTSLVAKKDMLLAGRIEEAIRKNESLESLTSDNVRRDAARDKITQQRGRLLNWLKCQVKKTRLKLHRRNPLVFHTKVASTHTSTRKSSTTKSGKTSAPAKSSKPTFKVSKLKSSNASSSKKAFVRWEEANREQKARRRGKSRASKLPSGGKSRASKLPSAGKSRASKLSVVGFRGLASYSDKKGSMRPS
ncbi:hypothetical protein Patl1_07972 [Pistacia atlantica]|uniref:Uncharacterized protein n=1 Tax=Pistacia atlantica TaxID=434234 RepID=A0ACC1AKT0_9ROSI|nr:hypothetical protein Patl1_07972 [Pistacia atlantica]